MVRWAWLLVAGSLACAGGPPPRAPDPLATTVQLAKAIERDEPRAAYALLDPLQQSRIGRERFEQLWRENRGELRELAGRLQESELSAKAHAYVELEDGERVTLVIERGQYRLAGGLLDAQVLASPLDAVAELRRALMRQSLPALLRVLARERRAAFVAAFEKSIAQTRDPLDLRVEQNGEDEATVDLTGGGRILLRREGGQWQIWDVQQALPAGEFARHGALGRGTKGICF